MTRVAFHFNVADRTGYVCRLLRKAVHGHARVVVTGPPDALAQLDESLWTFSAVDFVPHSYLQSEATVAAASPVVLLASMESAPHYEVLLNLGEAVAPGFDKFERVIEIVGLDERERQLARQRWKRYVESGYSITRHDLALSN